MSAPRPTRRAPSLANQRRSPEAIRRDQERKLAALLRHAYEHVSFYWRLYDWAGLSSGARRSGARLEAFTAPVFAATSPQGRHSSRDIMHVSTLGRAWKAPPAAPQLGSSAALAHPLARPVAPFATATAPGPAWDPQALLDPGGCCPVT